jgi:hypothetical protein
MISTSTQLDSAVATHSAQSLSPSSLCNSDDVAFDYIVLTNPGEPDQEGLFPTGEVHLVAGPSGAGKSTWLLQFIQAWMRGDAFFGRPVCPKKFHFITFDRPKGAMKRTLKRMRIADGLFSDNFTPATPSVPLPSAIEKLWKERPETAEAKVFFVEGLDMNVPDGKINDPGIVRKYLSSLQAFCQKNGVAIIGTVGSPKAKPGQQYTAPRDRIAGTAMWGRMTETIILIEPENPDSVDSIRKMQILTRNAKDEKHLFKFQNGLLVEIDSGATVPAKSNEDRVVAWLETKLQIGQTFTLASVEMALGMKKSSVQYVIEKLQERRWVEKGEYGVYVWKGKIAAGAEAVDPLKMPELPKPAFGPDKTFVEG